MQIIPDKLRVVLGHLEAASVMMALDLEPISVHVLLMAAEEITESYAERCGTKLFLSWKEIKASLPKQMAVEIHNARAKPYNFAKHADTDPHANYPGPSATDLYAVNALIWYATSENLLRLGLEPSPRMKLLQSICLIGVPDFFLDADLQMSKVLRTKIVLEFNHGMQDATRLGVHLNAAPELHEVLKRALALADSDILDTMLAGNNDWAK